METIDRLSAACSSFIAALEKVPTDPGFNQRVVDAYNAYAAIEADARKVPAATEVNQAFEAYRAVLRGGFSASEAGSQIRAAYLNYLAEVRAAWAETDSTTLAPADLAAIGQNLSYLAWLAEMGLDGSSSEARDASDDPIARGEGNSLWGSTTPLMDSTRVPGQI